MKQRLFSCLLFLALLCELTLISGCGNGGDSAADASAQLGLGGDDLSQPSQALEVMSEGAKAGVWTSDYPAAQKLAQELDLPILLFFNGSDWSENSNQLIKNAFAGQEWLDFLPNLVMVYLDFPRHNPNFPAKLKAQNEALRLQFAIRVLPSMLLCTSNGQPVGNLEVDARHTAHDLVRNIKLARRWIPSEVDKLVAGMDDTSIQERYATFKTLTEDRQKVVEKLKELDEMLTQLRIQLPEDITNWVIAQRTPEEQQAYRDATAAKESATEQLKALIQGNPANISEENQKKCQELQAEIQRQQLIIDEIIAK